jgi:hypothetical protein
MPVLPGYHVESKVRWSVVAPGLAGFGAFYLVSAAIGYAGINEGGAAMFIPVAGPFAEMKKASPGDPILAALGVGQAIGLGLGVGGLFFPRNVWVPNSPPASSLHFVPVAGRETIGVAVGGSL